MAKIGLKHPVAALANDTGSEITYSGGMVLAKAISANINITSSDVKLYADDAATESDNSFSSGTVEVGLDDLLSSAKVLLLGYTEGAEVDAATGEKELSTAGAEAPYVGVGFYARGKRGGTAYYRAIWLIKVKFSEPNDENTTKGATTEFKTPSITGNIVTASWDGTFWKQEARFSTEAAAQAWLDAKAGIGSGTTANLTGLSLADATLTPAFAGATHNYYATLSAGSTTVTATFAAGTAKLYADGAYVETLTSATASGAIAVAAGVAKLLEIVVTEPGKTAITYSIMAYYAE